MTVRRSAALAGLVVVGVVAVVALRQVSIGQREVAAADEAAARSDWPEAIAHARAAAEALVPGSPWPERGKLRLEAIGRDAEARGDDETSLLAYGALRTAALATSAPPGLWSSSRSWRPIAEEGLARVAASRPAIGTPGISTQAMLEDLRETQPPDTATRALLAAATLAVLGAVLMWGLHRAGVNVLPRLRPWR
jgi:hypothetical protein